MAGPSLSQHETFDVDRAMSTLAGVYDLRTLERPQETSPAMAEFFSVTFVGCPELRSGDIAGVAGILKKLVFYSESQRVRAHSKWVKLRIDLLHLLTFRSSWPALMWSRLKISSKPSTPVCILPTDIFQSLISNKR